MYSVCTDGLLLVAAGFRHGPGCDWVSGKLNWARAGFGLLLLVILLLIILVWLAAVVGRRHGLAPPQVAVAARGGPLAGRDYQRQRGSGLGWPIVI